MENREAFTGISAEVKDNIEEVNWKQRNFNQRGSSNYRGNNRGRLQPNKLQFSRKKLQL